MADCLPTYKGVRYQNLSEIHNKIQGELKDAEARKQSEPAKVSSPDIQQPDSNLSQYEIQSQAFQESSNYQKFEDENKTGKDFLMTYFGEQTETDPMKILEKHTQIIGEGFDKAKDGDIAMFTDEQGNLASYGQVIIDDKSQKKYYLSFDPTTSKQVMVNLDQAQKAFPKGFTAIKKDAPAQKPLYATPEQWQAVIEKNKQSDAVFTDWMMKGSSVEDQANKSIRDAQLKEEGISVDPENPTTYTPSDKWWWFKSGFNSSIIGKAYQLLSWNNLKNGLIFDLWGELVGSPGIEPHGLGTQLPHGSSWRKFKESDYEEKPIDRGYTVERQLFELHEYEPSMAEEIIAGATSILIDTPLFLAFSKSGSKAGVKLTDKAVEAMAKRNLIKYSRTTYDGLVSKGVNPELAKRMITNGINKAKMKAAGYGARFGGSITALALYDYTNDVLTQAVESDGDFSEIDYAHSLKEGLVGGTLGAGLGFVGLGNKAIVDAFTREGATAVERGAIKIGTGAVTLPVEAGLFVFGKRGLTGQPLIDDNTAREYGTMLGTLVLIKGQGAAQEKGNKLIKQSKDFVSEKIGKGKFKVEFDPEEIEYLNRKKNYGATTQEILSNLVKTHGKITSDTKRVSSIEIYDIMVDPEIPFTMKRKLVWSLGGYQIGGDPVITDVVHRKEGDKHYVELRNKSGELLQVGSTLDAKEAESRVRNTSMRILDNQKQNRFAELSEMEKALILSQLKSKGIEPAVVQESWNTELFSRTPDQQKHMDELYKATDELIREKEKVRKAANQVPTEKKPVGKQVFEKTNEADIKPELDTKISEQQKRLNLPTDPLQSMPDEINVNLKRAENKLPGDPVSVKQSSDFLYDEYKRLEQLKGIDTRRFTLQQIQDAQSKLETQITLLEEYHNSLSEGFTPVEKAVNEPPKKIERPQEAPKTKPEKQPWEMTKEEFEDANYNGEDVTGWIGSPESKESDILLAQADQLSKSTSKEDRDAAAILVNRAQAIADAFYEKNDHKTQIEKALSEGKPVSEEVLKDYPELQKDNLKSEKLRNDLIKQMEETNQKMIDQYGDNWTNSEEGKRFNQKLSSIKDGKEYKVNDIQEELIKGIGSEIGKFQSGIGRVPTGTPHPKQEKPVEPIPPVETKNNGDVIKDLYDEWSKIKDQKDHDAWAEKVKNTKFGTYESMDVLNVIENFDIPFKSKYDQKQFISEVEEALNVPMDKRTYKPKEVEIEPKSTVFEKFSPGDKVEVTTDLGDKLKGEVLYQRGEYDGGEGRYYVRLESGKEFSYGAGKLKKVNEIPVSEGDNNIKLDESADVIIGEVITQPKWSKGPNKLSIENVMSLLKLKNKDKLTDADFPEELENQGYIKEKELPGNDREWEITEKGKELITAIESRQETIRGLNEGADLFPENADINIIRENQKRFEPLKKFRQPIKSAGDSEKITQQTGIKLKTGTFETPKYKPTGHWNEFDFGDYEYLSTNKGERFSGEFVMSANETIDQNKPIYVVYFGEWAANKGYDMATASNDLNKALEIARDYDARDAWMEVYDPESKLMDAMDIKPFTDKITEQGVRSNIDDEISMRNEKKAEAEELRREKEEAERKQFEESVTPVEERKDPVEIAKDDTKAPDLPDEVYQERMKTYEEFCNESGFAIRTGGRRGEMASGYYATPGMSTYYDIYSENPEAKFYDVSFLDVITSGSPEAKKLLSELLKDESLTEVDRKKVEDALANDAHISYHLVDEVLGIRQTASKMGYDALKVWENDDAGSPSSLFVWNGHRVNEMGTVKDVRKTFMDGLKWKDPTLQDIPAAEEIEVPAPKKTTSKEYKPLNEKGQKKVMKMITNGKYAIPVLNQVHVKNGTATVSDLENYVSFKTSLPDGMYQFVGDDLVPSKTPLNEYVSFPDTSKKKSSVVLGDVKDVLRSALPFVSNDELRPVMSAVQIKSDGKTITYTSTDAHILHTQTINAKAPEFEILLPPKAIKILLSNPTKEPLVVDIFDQFAKITTGDFQLTTRLIDGKYPTWQAIIPEKTFVHTTVNRAELISAIDKLIPYSNKDSKNASIYFDPNTNEVVIEAKDIDMGYSKAIRIKSAEIEIGTSSSNELGNLRLQMPIKLSNNAIELGRNVLGVNLPYLKTVAESFDTETITMHDASKPEQTVKNRAFLFTGEKIPVSKKIAEEPKAEPKPLITPEKTKAVMDDFRRNFSSTENVSDVVGGKEATKFTKVNGFSVILDPGKHGITIESIWAPPEMRRKGVARTYMKELISLADKHDIPLMLRAVPEVVEGKEVIPKENLKSFYEKLGFVFQGDKGVRLPNTENKPRTEAKNTKGRKGLFANEGEVTASGASDKGKKTTGGFSPKQTEEPGGKKVIMEDAEIIIPEHWSKDVKPDVVFKAIDFPEIVDIVHKMIGRYPQPMNMRRPGLLGYFRHSDVDGMIALKRSLFHENNYDMLKYVLAHEVGHMNDWMPDKDMKRGNILGRISSDKGYLKSTLGEKPGKDNILTKQDRDRLQKEAKKQVREMSKKTEQQIIEEIVKEIPVFDEAGLSANDVAAIWRDVNSRDKYPELYDYVARLSADQKSQIMKEALKGIVNSEIASKFKKQIGTQTITEQVIKMIRPLAVTKENISKMYKKLLMDEINKRRLFDKETIIKELLEVTNEWRRYDPARASGEEKKYRESAEELYADAFAMLMNNPEKLQRMAPVFYNAYFNWWDAKTGSRAYFDEIQNILNGGNGDGRVPGLGENLNDSPLDQRRMDNIIDGYKEGEQERTDIANEKDKKGLGFFSRFRYEFISNREESLNKVKRDVPKKLQTNLNDQQAIDNATQMLYFTRDKLGEVLTDINQIVEVPLQNAGLSPYEFGALLELERNLGEQYKDKARPLGMQSDPSRQLKTYIYSRYTPEQVTAMEKIIQDFHDKVYSIMDYAHQNGLFTPDQWKVITDNKDVYATYSKVKYIHDNYISPKILEAEGSLEKNENPFISTVFKMASTYKAAERNRAAVAVVNDMLKHAPDEIVIRNPIRVEGGRPIGWQRAAKDKDYIYFMEDGHMKGAEVDQYIADIFNHPDSRHKFDSFVNIFRQYNHVFKPMVTSLNVGWAFYNNPSRDARRSMRNLFTILYSTEGVSKSKAFSVVPKFMAGYAQQINPFTKNTTAKNYVRNTLDASVREMIDNGAITRGFFGSYDPYITDQLEPLFKSHGFIGKEKSTLDKMKEKTFFTRQAANLVDKMLFMSSVIEATPKIVGYNILKDAMKNEMSAAYYTRNYVGTPFYYEKGRQSYWSNEILPFSNVILQGMAADLRLASSPKTRYAYHMYQIMNTSSVALVTAGAAAGIFGDDLKRLFGKIDDYIKYNYYVIPITETEKGRPVYVTIPMDEFGRLNYSMTYSLATTFFKATKKELKGFDQWWKQFNQVRKIGTGMVPSFSPLADIANGIGMYLNDQNIKDSFTNKDVIPPRAFESGKLTSAPYVGKWAIEKSGARWAVKLFDRNKGEDNWIEYILKNVPVLNRALRIGGMGDYAKYRDAVEPIVRERAQELLKMDRVINDIIVDAKKNNKDAGSFMDYFDQAKDEYFGKDGYDPTNEQYSTDMKGMMTKFQTRMMRGFSTPSDQLVSAVIDFGQSKEQQLAILKKGMEGFTNDEFNEIIINLRMYGVISKEVALEAFQTANPEFSSDYEKLIESAVDND